MKLKSFIANLSLAAFVILLTIGVFAWTQSNTKELTLDNPQQINCAIDVNFNILTACYDNESIRIIVKNTGIAKINGFLIKSYIIPDDPDINDITLSLEISEIGSIEYQSLSNVRYVEIVPKIKLGNRIKACNQIVKRHGDLASPGLHPC